jgi:prepilin signal peptidase PulO-like enzyme (type II secretory pathway)
MLAAKHYRIPLALYRVTPMCILCAGTIAECAAVSLYGGAATKAMLITALSAAVTAAACDAVCGYVFDSVTIPCLAMMILIAAASHAVVPFAAGAAAGGGCLGLLYLATLGRGLGLGDVKFACCIGGTLGALGALEALGVAFVLGGAYASIALLGKYARRGDEMRFAPYLAAGFFTVVFHGALA